MIDEDAKVCMSWQHHESAKNLRLATHGHGESAHARLAFNLRASAPSATFSTRRRRYLFDN